MFRLSALVFALAAAAAISSCLPREQKGGQDTGPKEARAQADPTAQRRPRPSIKPAEPTRTEEKRAPIGSARALQQAQPPRGGADDPALTRRFADGFERSTLGDNWRATSKEWKIEKGQLCVSNAYNHPVWLKRRLPLNARIEFDAVSHSDDGDIKAEFWGDGRSAASTVSYNNATSYLTIFGGWKNRFHVLARIDEHAKNRQEIRIDLDSDDLRAQPVERSRQYHFKVERRDGKTVRWLVDDLEMLKLTDKQPLIGKEHEHFGFNNWSVRVCFDNLEIVRVAR